MKSQGPIQLLLVMLLASLLKVKAQSSIAKTDNSEQYGIISKSTALTCTDSSAAPGSTFTFLKNNVIILTNLGEVGPSGKYSATASSGSIQMTIQDVVISDEDSYSCTVGFGAAASPYNLQVTVQPTNNTCTGPGNDYSGDLLTFTCTDLYPLPSVQSVMDGTQTIVGTNTTLKTNNLYDLQWTALASSSPKTYILAVAITTRSTYTVYLEITIKGPPTTTTTTTTIPPTTTTESTTASATTPTTTTTTHTTTTTEITATSSATTTEAITTTTPTITSGTTDSIATYTAPGSNESTVIIVVASTVGGVVLVGLVVFLVGLFLYRARRPGHWKHNHRPKRNTRRQHYGGAYIFSGQNNGHIMAMHPSMASYVDTIHGNPHSIKDYTDRRPGVTSQKQANGRHEGSQMRNTSNVKSRYIVHPGNMVPSRNTQNFFPHHYPRQDELQRPATTGNIHPGHVNHALESGYTYYHPQDYSDNWDMY